MGWSHPVESIIHNYILSSRLNKFQGFDEVPNHWNRWKSVEGVTPTASDVDGSDMIDFCNSSSIVMALNEVNHELR